MKKIVKILGIIFVLAVCSEAVFAQRDIRDYEYQYEKYREVHSNYTTSRDKYLKYQTLSTRDQALAAVKKAAKQRNKVLRTYLIVLKNRVGDSLVSPVSLKAETLTALRSKIQQVEEHRDSLQKIAVDDYSALFDSIEEIEEEEAEFYRLIYKSLLVIELGKIQEAQQEAVFLREDFSAYAQKVGKLEKLDFWLSSVRGKNRASEQKSNQAKDKFVDFEETDSVEEVKSVYLEIKNILEESRSELNKSASYQEEIYKEVVNE